MKNNKTVENNFIKRDHEEILKKNLLYRMVMLFD